MKSMKHPDFLSPMEEAQVEKPSADKSARFVTDRMIRKKGYRIKHRRKNEEAVWERHGIEFRQSDVIRREGLR